jgi:invasion protein IalB
MATNMKVAQSSWYPWSPSITSPAAPAAAPAAPAAPPAPVPFRTEMVRYDQWVATCNDFTEGPRKKICTAQLVVQQSGTNQILLAWLVTINENKQFVMGIQTPTGVKIAPGVELELEKVTKRVIPYESCEPGRCVASMVMDAALMRDITASSKAQLSIHAVNGQILKFDIPIKGFDKATTQLRSAI